MSPLEKQTDFKHWSNVIVEMATGPGRADPFQKKAVDTIIGLSRYVRGQMVEVLESDYVRTAHSKGLPEDTVHYVHALRNAALPFVTMFGMLLPALIGGSVIFETIFAWPGMGRMAFEAVLTRDFPIIISVNFIAAILILIGTFISDILYAIVDPRIRL